MATLVNKLAANKRFEFASNAFEADKFAVVNMTGFEAISKPFRFTLTLVSDDSNVDFETVLQNTASFRIFAPDGASSVPYYGVLAEFEQLQQSDGYVFYRAVLVPRLWHLSLYQMSEVYLNEQTIPQIVEKVLKSSRLGRADYAMKLSGSYRERSFVCQYQETHLDFLSRWMEKEGMYFYFDHDGTAEQLVVVDNRSMHPAQAVKVLYRPVNELDTGSAADSVQDFVCRQKPMPQKVVLRDYNHRKASVELKVSETVFVNGIGEVNLYGENFRNEAEGQRYAKLRAEEILCSAKVFTGEATAVGLRSGYFMKLIGHYRDNFNGQYLVTEVHHEGSQAGALLAGIQSSYSEGSGETIYRSTFRAIPAATQFRAERTTAKPRVTGTMNAIIDSEGSGNYADLDEYGQYKVQLPFDNSDKVANKGSARIRMASPYAGSGHGMDFPLHKDAEVLLSFIDGDPDQPVILGAVPNSENPSVVNNRAPYENLIKTAGGNLLRMSDETGKEQIKLVAKDGSKLALGSSGGIWQSTKGSSESLTIGTTNSLFLGFKNSASLSIENALSVGVTNKATVGMNVGFTLGADVNYRKGPAYSFAQKAYSRKSWQESTGAEEVTIRGGQQVIAKAVMDGIDTATGKVVAVALAVNAACAIAAGIMISKYEGAGVGAEKEVLNLKDDDYEIQVARGLGIAGGLASAALIAGLLYKVSQAVAAASEGTFASNLKLGLGGIDLTVDNLPLLNKSSIGIKNEEIKFTVGSVLPVLSMSEIDLKKNEIKLTANGVPLLTSSLELTSTAATLSTNNPAGAVNLTQPLGGSIKLDAAGLTATSGVAELTLGVASGAVLKGGPTSKLIITPALLSASAGTSRLLLSGAEASLEGPGSGSSITMAGVQVKVDGDLILLG